MTDIAPQTITRIFVTTNADHADRTAGFWKTKAGMTVSTAGPTDLIELTAAESDLVLWKNSSEGPWHIVVAAPKPAKPAVPE